MEPRVKKLIGWSVLGVAVLMLLLVVVALWMFDSSLKDMRTTLVRSAEPGWLDSVRSAGRVPPELAGLAATPTAAGNAAELAWDSAAIRERTTWTNLGLAYDRLMRTEASPLDSAALRDLATDTTLDRWAAWLGRADWQMLPLMLAATPAADRDMLHQLAMPNYLTPSALGAALAARGAGRALRQNLAGARADFALVARLGHLMVTRDVSVLGFMVGRRAVHRGSWGLAWVGTATRDTALARQAAVVRDWSRTRANRVSLLHHVYDAALSIASDSTLAPGLRQEGLTGMISARLASAWALTFGARNLDHAVAAVPVGGDSIFAPLPSLAASTVRRINRMGPKYRLMMLSAF